MTNLMLVHVGEGDTVLVQLPETLDRDKLVAALARLGDTVVAWIPEATVIAPEHEATPFAQYIDEVTDNVDLIWLHDKTCSFMSEEKRATLARQREELASDPPWLAGPVPPAPPTNAPCDCGLEAMVVELRTLAGRPQEPVEWVPGAPVADEDVLN